MTLLKWLTFLLGFLTVTLTVHLFCGFIFLDYMMDFRPQRNSDHIVFSVSIDVPSNSKGDAKFYCIAYDYSFANWDNLGVSVAASEFFECVQVGIDVSPYFSAACAAVIARRNHLLHLYQQSESKIKFRLTINHCKRVLEAAKLAYAY